MYTLDPTKVERDNVKGSVLLTSRGKPGRKRKATKALTFQPEDQMKKTK